MYRYGEEKTSCKVLDVILVTMEDKFWILYWRKRNCEKVVCRRHLRITQCNVYENIYSIIIHSKCIWTNRQIDDNRYYVKPLKEIILIWKSGVFQGVLSCIGNDHKRGRKRSGKKRTILRADGIRCKNDPKRWQCAVVSGMIFTVFLPFKAV